MSRSQQRRGVLGELNERVRAFTDQMNNDSERLRASPRWRRFERAAYIAIWSVLLSAIWVKFGDGILALLK